MLESISVLTWVSTSRATTGDRQRVNKGRVDGPLGLNVSHSHSCIELRAFMN